MIANRTSGLAVFLFALAMLFLVIPAHTETVGSGWMKPDTLPVLCCYALALLGAALMVRPRGGTDLKPGEIVRFVAILLVAAACAWAMGRFGFLPGAVVLVVLAMLASGERRPVLIGSVALVLPAATWLIIVQLLGRSLP